MPSLTAAQKTELNNMKLPQWVDRKKIGPYVAPPGSPPEPKCKFALNQNLPVKIMRKELRAIKSVSKRMHRLFLRNVGEVISLEGGNGELLYYRVVRPGWISVRYVDTPKRRVLIFGRCANRAVLEFDVGLYEEMNVDRWRNADGV